MPTLTYFDFPGSRGEECRLALHIAGVEFTDNRIQGGTWPELKPNTPWGALPTFEVEGQPTLAQSNAILAYIGREHGLLPSDSWQAARHEAFMAAAEELRAHVTPTLRIKDEGEKQAAREALVESYLRPWGTFVERELGVVGSDPFVGGSSISVADLKLYMISRWFSRGIVDHVPADVFAHAPRLIALERAVHEHPKVVDWYSK